jgi:thioester reductase-like protein
MPSVFLLGATGFLGGSVLTDLQKDGSYEITALVRPGKEQLVSARGVRVVTVRGFRRPTFRQIHGR